MGFKCGIVGLPNVGKSTIFNALTQKGAAAANYPFCTIDPNVGIVDIPDKRLAEIDVFVRGQRIVPASMEFVDIAGLVKGASKGEGLGNKFLSHIRETDAICHIVRCFASGDIVHVEGSVNPIRDIEIIQSELVISDYQTVENTMKRYDRLAKSGNKLLKLTHEMLVALYAHLEEFKPARLFDLTPWKEEEREIAIVFRDMHLITSKKVFYVLNVSEDEITGPDSDIVQQVKAFAQSEGAQSLTLCGKIEEELSSLSKEDRLEFLKDLGIEEPCLDKMIRVGFDVLGLMTYFTAGEKEIHAWTISRGTKAPQAAGVIHSDFERGYICA